MIDLLVVFIILGIFVFVDFIILVGVDFVGRVCGVVVLIDDIIGLGIFSFVFVFWNIFREVCVLIVVGDGEEEFKFWGGDWRIFVIFCFMIDVVLLGCIVIFNY